MTGKPATIRALQWLLALVCAWVVVVTAAVFLDSSPPSDPLDEYGAMMENLAEAALILAWVGAALPAAFLLLAIRLRRRAVSWAALVFAVIVFVLGLIATANDGLEGPGDARPWLLAYFAAVLVLTVLPKSLAFLRVVRPP